MIQSLNWIVDQLLPALFTKLDSWYLFSGVSVLGIVAAGFVISFIYGRFT